MSITNILSNYQSGFSKANLFEVEIHPSFFVDSNTLTMLKAYVKNAQFPFMTFTKESLEYNNEKYNYVTGRDYDDVTISYYADGSAHLLEFFNNWLSLIKTESGHLKFKSEYIADVNIMMLNEQNEEVKRCTLVNAFPINISTISLDYSTRDTINEFSVTYTYDKIEY